MKRLLVFLLGFFVVTETSSQIVINEYSAANYDSYTDNYGEYEDWLELYNPTAIAVDINGWYLSDKINNPTKWVIPSSFIIPAMGTALIYCSGRDEIIGGNAHSNFKITQTKGNEVFMLTDAANVLQDSIRVLPNQKGHARGREVDGSSNWSVFLNGTPNANNTGAMQEYATTPIFSQIGGYYSASVSLTLSSPDPNITIYYTTNGDEPNNGSTQYVGPFNITATSVVKAVAYSDDPLIPPSFIDYHTFFINDTHTIPILSISGNQVDNLLNGSAGLEPEGTIEWFDKNGVLLDKGTGEYNKHGNDSWAYAQRGFDYIMRDQFGYNHALQDQIFATKSRDKFQRVIVKAAANDNYPFSYGGSGAHVRDAYVHHLSQIGDLRLDERSTSSCIVYLDGEYWGVYEMREKVDDSDFLDYYYDQDELFPGSTGNIQYLKTWGGTWTEYGAPNAQTDWDNFVNFVTSNPMTNQANYNQAKSEYNMGSLIDYFLLNSYVVCQDWLNWNTAWWRGLDPNGDKKKWRYTLWDMDNTFDHGTNYTGIPSSDPDAEPCDASTLGNTGGQGHVPIWNEMLTNEEFHDDYINRWQDLANGPLSCAFMIHILDSMIAVIDPEMPRQITTWGGSYANWQSNVTDLRNFILARCDSMNSGFVACDSAITGIFDVTVEIIGVGEVEMSNNNVINNFNTPFVDQRFGGISLPFKVVSGTFDHWEVVSSGSAYIYDPSVDTLTIDLQSDVIIKAFFGENRDIVFDIDPQGTTSGININGTIVNAFPYTTSLLVGENIALTPLIDAMYGFDSWSSDSNLLSPSTLTELISFTVAHNDTIKLHLYQKPTIVYNVNPSNTSTTININGVNIALFPYSTSVFTDDINTLVPNIDPNYGFGFWDANYNALLNGGAINNSFYGLYDDTITLNLSSVSAFIAGNDTICENGAEKGKVSVSFAGEPPFTFSFAINGVPQPLVPPTTINPYIINTNIAGNYTLVSYSDGNEFGSVGGQAIVTTLTPPIANFNVYPDSITILFPNVQLTDESSGDIISWEWDFGDNTTNSNIQNPYHSYKDSLGIYQITLIVADNKNCIDTARKIISVTDEYWIYIPNSFTPDYDGINDRFCISYNGIRKATFNFNVFDRFSNLVYATNDIDDLSCENGWDGKHYQSDQDLPMGGYIYQIYYQDFEGWKYQETSEIIIVR